MAGPGRGARDMGGCLEKNTVSDLKRVYEKFFHSREGFLNFLCPSKPSKP